MLPMQIHERTSTSPPSTSPAQNSFPFFFLLLFYFCFLFFTFLLPFYYLFITFLLPFSLFWLNWWMVNRWMFFYDDCLDDITDRGGLNPRQSRTGTITVCRSLHAGESGLDQSQTASLLLSHPALSMTKACQAHPSQGSQELERATASASRYR